MLLTCQVLLPIIFFPDNTAYTKLPDFLVPFLSSDGLSSSCLSPSASILASNWSKTATPGELKNQCCSGRAGKVTKWTLRVELQGTSCFLSNEVTAATICKNTSQFSFPYLTRWLAQISGEIKKGEDPEKGTLFPSPIVMPNQQMT